MDCSGSVVKRTDSCQIAQITSGANGTSVIPPHHATTETRPNCIGMLLRCRIIGWPESKTVVLHNAVIEHGSEGWVSNRLNKCLLGVAYRVHNIPCAIHACAQGFPSSQHFASKGFD